MRKILEKCPACGAALEVTRLGCRQCQTVIEGVFVPCTFCKLSPDSLEFVTTFVRTRGNLKEIERELGMSYPTVRGRLQAVLEELGFGTEEQQGERPPGEQELAAQRRAILARLEEGRISVDEAVVALERLP